MMENSCEKDFVRHKLMSRELEKCITVLMIMFIKKGCT